MATFNKFQPMELPRWKDDSRGYRREWAKRRRKSHPDYAKSQSASTRRWQKRNPIKNAINNYRIQARKRGFTLELSEMQFENLILAACFYCGAQPNPVNGV